MKELDARIEVIDTTGKKKNVHVPPRKQHVIRELLTSSPLPNLLSGL